MNRIGYLRRPSIGRVAQAKAYVANTSYANVKWIAVAKAFIARYPFCVLCLAHGKINEGAAEYQSTRQRNLVVDHITRHGGVSELFWDEENWQTLCRYPCHDVDKSRCENRGIDWLEYVAAIVREKKTEEFVSNHAEWIPSHVAARLSLRLGGV